MLGTVFNSDPHIFRYYDISDELGFLDRDRLESNFGFQLRRTPNIHRILDSLDGLGFTYYGQLFFRGKALLDWKHLPESQYSYILKNLTLVKDLVTNPKGFEIIKPGPWIESRDINDETFLVTRSPFYYQPVGSELHNQEKLEDLISKYNETLSFLTNLPPVSQEGVAELYLLGYENLLNLSTFTGYAIYNTYLKLKLRTKEPIQRQEFSRKRSRINLYWPLVISMIRECASGYMASLLRDQRSLDDNLDKTASRVEQIFYSDPLQLMNMRLQYRLREGDRINEIILHSLNTISKMPDDMYGQPIDTFAILWGGSYTGPLFSALYEYATGGDSHFDYVQFSRHEDKIRRHKFLVQAQNYLTDLFLENFPEILEPNVNLDQHSQEIFESLLPIARDYLVANFNPEIPVFTRDHLKESNRHKIVIDDTLGTSLTMYFVAATLNNYIQHDKHELITTIGMGKPIGYPPLNTRDKIDLATRLIDEPYEKNLKLEFASGLVRLLGYSDLPLVYIPPSFSSISNHSFHRMVKRLNKLWKEYS